jgi:predicted deacylase
MYLRLRYDPEPEIGDADGVVPYSHATRLQEALDEVGVANELVTIRGGGHGGFNAEQSARAYASIMDFLEKHGVFEKRQSPPRGIRACASIPSDYVANASKPQQQCPDRR